MYLYLVYESFIRYKHYDKFYEVAITETTVSIREKYIDKDSYKLEFFELLQEYAEKTLRYIQDKFLKSSFPVNVRSGELQGVCKEFISRCKTIHEEKLRPPPPPRALPVQMPAQQQQQQRAIALIIVVCNSDALTLAEFLQQVFVCSELQVCQHAMMLTEQVTMLMGWFHTEF